MSESLWEFEHSVECGVPREFAWKYWTNPKNWDDPPARFEFDGPFAVGTEITTILSEQELKSVIREVEQGGAALIEMDVPGATVKFRWRFEELSTRRSRITQSLSLSEGAARGLVEQAKALERSVPQGMKKLAVAIERGWAERSG